MFYRPLVPALCATITGILIGHTFLTNINLPLFLIPLIILIYLGITFLIPLKLSPLWLLALFFLIGINSQINKPNLSGMSHIIGTNEKVIIEGTISTPPKIRFNLASVTIHAEKIFFSKTFRKVKTDLFLKIYGYHGGLKVGERIRFPAKLKEFENFNNPGNFDYRFYMRSRGLFFVAIVSDGKYVVPMGEGELRYTEKVLEKVRGPLRKFFYERLSQTTCPIYTALILGERQGITSKIREPFDRAGVSHIMAVSGLHLGLVAWLFFISIRWLLSFSYRLTLATDIKKLAAVITTLPVITYGFLTGLHLSTQRAMVMILVFLWSYIIGREKDPWSSLSLAAIIILAFNGDALFTVSFQLSFVAVAGILWLAPGIFSRISTFTIFEKYFHKGKIIPSILTYASGLIAVTIAATIMTMPLIAHHFHRFTMVSLPANLTVVPIIGLWVIPLGLLSSVTLLLSSSLAGSLLSLGESGLTVALSFVQLWSDIPWSSIWVIQPNWLEIILLYGLFFLSLNITFSRLCRILFILSLVVFFIDSGYWVFKVRCNKDLRVTILDAGRKTLSLIQFPGKEKMILSFNAFGRKGANLSRMVVTPYLWHEKIQRIDYLFSDNPDVRQAKDLQFLINTFQPKGVFSSLSKERVIKGVKVEGGNRKGIMIGYQGWLFLFNDQKVQIEKERGEKEKNYPTFLILPKGKKKYRSPFHIINIGETGALTISINPKGDLKMNSFLKPRLWSRHRHED